MPHEFLVAGALIETAAGLLLVKNQRRHGLCDWSPPGGVIDPTDDSVTAGLAREVAEETSLVVTAWDGPLYEVRTVAPDMGWRMRCEVYRAAAFTGELHVDDPDGIVVEAAYVPADDCIAVLEECHPWVREPLQAWLTERWATTHPRAFDYEVHGGDAASARVVRTA